LLLLVMVATLLLLLLKGSTKLDCPAFRSEPFKH